MFIIQFIYTSSLHIKHFLLSAYHKKKTNKTHHPSQKKIMAYKMKAILYPWSGSKRNVSSSSANHLMSSIRVDILYIFIPGDCDYPMPPGHVHSPGRRNLGHTNLITTFLLCLMHLSLICEFCCFYIVCMCMYMCPIIEKNNIKLLFYNHLP